MINQPTQIIKILIDNKTYEKVCTCNYYSIKTFPQSDIKVKNKKIDFNSLINKPKEDFIYTQETQDKAIRLIAAKKIIKQSKTIDFQRFILKTIINTNNNIDFIIFICKKLDNYKAKDKVNKNIELKKLSYERNK